MLLVIIFLDWRIKIEIVKGVVVMNTFFIADPHFGHAKIIDYENRPFADVTEMDHKLIENWNSVVTKSDKVYLLGDFSFYNKEKSAQILRKLKGMKYLVMGNHDSHSVTAYYDMGFHRVYDIPVILEDFWILSHEPLYINSNMPYANIFGHVHGNKEYSDFSGQSFCVSVERINYTPVTFHEIKKKIGVIAPLKSFNIRHPC